MTDFKAKMHQIRFRLGLRPRPRWGSLQRSPRSPSWIWGALLLRRGEGREEREGEGGGKGRGGEGKGHEPPPPLFGGSLRLWWEGEGKGKVRKRSGEGGRGRKGRRGKPLSPSPATQLQNPKTATRKQMEVVHALRPCMSAVSEWSTFWMIKRLPKYSFSLFYALRWRRRYP